jgi:hypothetical protein
MRLSTVILTLLTTLAFAQTPNYCAGDKTIVGYCTITGYTDKTTSVTNPPTPAECNDACRGVQSDAGDWIVDFTGRPAGYLSPPRVSIHSIKLY